MRLMKTLALKVTAIFLLLSLSAKSQVLLQDFSSVFDGGNYTFYYGTWEATGNTAGSGNPNAQFVQGSGVYNITGTSSIIPTDNSTSGIEFFNASPVNLNGNLYLSVTAQALAGNLASSFAVTLKDTGGNSAYAAFSLTGFPNGGYTTQTQILTPVGAFNSGSIDSLVISGNQLGGTATFNVSFDTITAVASAPVPEPATYAAIFGMAALGLVAYRRRQKLA